MHEIIIYVGKLLNSQNFVGKVSELRFFLNMSLFEKSNI